MIGNLHNRLELLLKYCIIYFIFILKWMKMEQFCSEYLKKNSKWGKAVFQDPNSISDFVVYLDSFPFWCILLWNRYLYYYLFSSFSLYFISFLFQDTPAVKATYTAEVKAPSELVVLMSALRDGHKEEGNGTVFR